MAHINTYTGNEDSEAYQSLAAHWAQQAGARWFTAHPECRERWRLALWAVRHEVDDEGGEQHGGAL